MGQTSSKVRKSDKQHHPTSPRKSKHSKTKRKKSTTLGRRLSKKKRSFSESTSGRLIGGDSSLSSVDTIESRKIKSQTLSGKYFARIRLLSVESSTEYTAEGYRHSTLLFTSDGSLDQDLDSPSPTDNETTVLVPADELDRDKTEEISYSPTETVEKNNTPLEKEDNCIPLQDFPVPSITEKTSSSPSSKLIHANTVQEFTELPVFVISTSSTSLIAELKDTPRLSRSESVDILTEEVSSTMQARKSSLLSRFRSQRFSSSRNVTFQEECEDLVLTKPKSRSLSMINVRRGKTYGSVKLRKKKSKGSIVVSDKPSGPWTMSTEELDASDRHNNHLPLRNSAIHERDLFLELLSQVQDNRYENQRYTLKAGSINDTEEDDVFETKCDLHEDTDTININGSFPNGTVGCTSPDLDLPSVEVSPVCTLESSGPRHAVSLNGLDNHEELGSEQSPEDNTRQSLSPSFPTITAGSALTPGRRSMEALKKVIESEGPYPLLIESPEGGFWIQNGEYESAKGDDGIWRAPEISTEHYTVQSDLTALAYGGHFYNQEHNNYIARDPTVGPVLLSLKFENDYQGTQVRAILRTQTDTMYKVFPASQLSSNPDIPDYIRYVSGERLETDKAYKIDIDKATDLIRKFDEHPVAKTHKIGVIYQQFGQTSEEEVFGNVEHSESLDEFMSMLGTKVNLKGFDGYRGGLDVANDQTGESSVYTTYKDRQIMFHVSTLLPHDRSDPQHVQKKRHIGNDIVVIVFQDENTPFCPSAIRSHFIHSYIAVQVEHPNTDHTIYKVAVTAKDEVPQFGPPLPDPAVFQKGSDFRDWLLTKILNAEYNCHMAPSFKKLANRTRSQLFLHLVEEITQNMDDVDYPSLTKGLSLTVSGRGSVSDIRSPKNRRRRRTLGGIFSTKKESQISLAFPKRKSISGSPRIYRKLRSEPSSPREMIIGSTPDLASASNQNEHSASDYPVLLANGRPSLGHATPDLAELSRGVAKGKFKRRFTVKKDNKEETKERKKPKRTKSVGGPSGHTLTDYFKKRKDSTSPVIKRSPVKRDSSEESSVSSSLNWSVPYDLPSVVEAEMSAKRHHKQLKNSERSVDDYQINPTRYQSNPTILERQESAVSMSDIQITMPGRTRMVDVAIQVTPYDWSNPFLSSYTTAHSDRDLRGVKVANISPLNSKSLPATPKNPRKPESSSRYEVTPKHSSSVSPPPIFMHIPGSQQETQREESEKRHLENVLKSIQSSNLSLEKGHEGEELVIHRAESTDSISTDVGDLYDALLQSLQSLTEDVTKLREQNLILSKENVKFATQNSNLKEKHQSMKSQLSSTQKQIHTLQLKLRLYQPNFSLGDEHWGTDV